jgi:hypothetical protein
MNIPTIGSKVSITVRFRTNYLYAPEPYEDVELTGTVVKSQRWVDADSFSLETTDASYPVKIIPSRKFLVKGSKGEYTVTQNGKHYSCTCIGFKYHGKCKHITAVAKM